MKYKYGKNELKIFKTLAILCSVTSVFLFLMLMIRSGSLGFPASDFSTGDLVSWLSFQISLPAALLCWYGVLDGRRYEKRLSLWGLQLPEDKKGLFLPPANIPCAPGEAEICSESIILAVFAALVSAGIVIFAAIHILHYTMLGLGSDAAGAAFFICGPLCLAWLIAALVCHRQRLTALYRDEADPIPYKKARISLFKGLLVMIIGLGITAALLTLPHSMTEYVYRSRLQTIYGDDWHEHIGETIP